MILSDKERNERILKSIKAFDKEHDTPQKCRNYLINVLGTHNPDGTISQKYGGKLYKGMKMNKELTEIEKAAYEKFRVKHYKHGGNHSVTFTSSPIGWGVDVKCIDCGKVKDITDFGCW